MKKGKEDLRVTKTLDSIDRSLLENLKTTSFSKITVESICSKAKINRTTFYKHYSDKYELMDDYLQRILEDFKSNCGGEFVEANPGQVSVPEFRVPFIDSVDFLISKRDIYEILWTANLDRDVFDEMVQANSENIMKRTQIKDPSIKTDPSKFFKASLFANLFSYNFLMSMRWWFANDNTISKDEYLEIYDRIMDEGLFKAYKIFL